MRVERFIQSRLRNMMMPATLGIGLAIGAGGCGSNNDANQEQKKNDASEIVPVYSAPMSSDAKSDLPPAVPAYMAQQNKDAENAVAVYSAPQPQDAAVSDAGDSEANPPMDVQGADGSGTKDDVGGATMKYLAQFPDAGPVTRYMGPQPLYMAIQPDENA